MSERESAAGAGPSYVAPALEKGLDVLELLAGSAGPLTQSEIAAAQGRSVGQLFRVLLTLERRGYAVRTEEGGYVLSDRLFELAHRQEPRRGLLAAAAGPMRRLAEEIGQSCNLGVREGDVVRVLAQAESPSPFGFGVRVGASFPLAGTVTGSVLRAFSSDDAGPDDAERVDAERDDAAADGQDARGRLERRDRRDLEGIRRAGRGERSDSLHAGVTDVVVPILGPDGTAAAALTVPYVSTSYSTVGLDAVRDAVRRAAEEIGRALGRPAP